MAATKPTERAVVNTDGLAARTNWPNLPSFLLPGVFGLRRVVALAGEGVVAVFVSVGFLRFGGGDMPAVVLDFTAPSPRSVACWRVLAILVRRVFRGILLLLDAAGFDALFWCAPNGLPAFDVMRRRSISRAIVTP